MATGARYGWHLIPIAFAHSALFFCYFSSALCVLFCRNARARFDVLALAKVREVVLTFGHRILIHPEPYGSHIKILSFLDDPWFEHLLDTNKNKTYI